jgi:hypothetical protein
MTSANDLLSLYVQDIRRIVRNDSRIINKLHNAAPVMVLILLMTCCCACRIFGALYAMTAA